MLQTILKEEDKKIEDEVDEIISDAYEIGFVHCRNSYETKKEKIDSGWGKCSKRIFKLMHFRDAKIIKAVCEEMTGKNKDS